MLAIDEQNNELKKHLEEKPGEILEYLAKSFQLSLLQTVKHLPESMWKTAPGEKAFDALKEIAKWGDVTTIVHTNDVILEFIGAFPDGNVGRGFYNLKSGSTTPKISGHLTIDNCKDIIFLRRPFMNLETASVLFFNKDGGCMFKIFIGRDESKKLKQNQLEAFTALSDQLTN